MKFAPLIEKIANVSNEAQFRSCFMEHVGELVGATAWGLDILNGDLQVIQSDIQGLPESFRDCYQKLGRKGDLVSQHMIQEQIPVHNISMQSLDNWHQSDLYRSVFRPYGIEHGMVAPLIGKSRLVGGIYFMREKKLPAFCDRDIIQLSSLCQHLSVRLATLRIFVAPSLADRLTPRESEIINLVAQGLSNREIALKLYVGCDAIKQSLKRMFRKLDVSTRAEMIAKLNSCLFCELE